MVSRGHLWLISSILMRSPTLMVGSMQHVENTKPALQSIQRFKVAAIVGFCLSTMPVFAADNTIKVAADPWCPYNCDSTAEHQGIMVDVARAALALSGHRLDYSIINWARAKAMVKVGDLDGIVGMSLSPDSQALYVFPQTPLGLSQLCFFKRAEDNWTYGSVPSLQDKYVGWINDFGVGGDIDLDQWVKDKKGDSHLVLFAGNEVHKRLISTLLAKRIDTFIEDRNVIAYQLKQKDIADKVKIAGCLESFDQVHLAFSPKVNGAKQWAIDLDAGVKELQRTGELAKILDYYGLTPETWLSH